MCNAKENIDFNIELSEPGNLITKCVNKDVSVCYDIFFKNQRFNLPLSRHERPFKEVKILDERIDDYNGKSWGIEKYEYKTCPECGSSIIAIDPLRGERVCECGLTNKRGIMINIRNY